MPVALRGDDRRWAFKSAAGLPFSRMTGSELDVIQDTKFLRGQFD
jgi:hypothetical protein